MSIREINDELFSLKEREETLLDVVAGLNKRLRDVEHGQSFLARRDPPRIPPFPKVLRLYGLLPPEERAAT